MSENWRDTPCIEWTKYRTKLGYGRRSVDGVLWTTHRLAWTEAYGPIPEGMCVCHHCDNPPCHNIEHLFLGTHADNVRDMHDKGRARNGQEAKTHCPHGHEYTEENTWLNHRPNGAVWRECRTCKRRQQREWQLANRKRRAA